MKRFLLCLMILFLVTSLSVSCAEEREKVYDLNCLEFAGDPMSYVFKKVFVMGSVEQIIEYEYTDMAVIDVGITGYEIVINSESGDIASKVREGQIVYVEAVYVKMLEYEMTSGKKKIMPYFLMKYIDTYHNVYQLLEGSDDVTWYYSLSE